MIPLVDAHLDLAWSALSWDRDLALPIDDLRAAESQMTDDRARGHATVCLPEMKRARLALCVGTLLARTRPNHLPEKGFRRTDLDHTTRAAAYATARGQLAWYRLLAERNVLRIITTATQLDEHWRAWSADPDNQPVGLILGMEGADPVICPHRLDDWTTLGVRIIEPVHYGRSAYAVGTGDDGPLTPAGRDLLSSMHRLHVILDVTHLSDTSMAEALDIFQGHVMASHHNCRAIAPNPRQLADDQIQRLVARNAVIGLSMDAWMLHPGWQTGVTPRYNVTFDAIANHVDHICQLAGSANHVAIGSDLDGGFGYERTPQGLDSIADLQNLAPTLARRGYSDDDINNIFHNNWLTLFRRALPG